MALKDLLALADDKLSDIYHRKAPDVSKLRTKLARQIDKEIDKFKRTEPVRGKRWFKVANSVVEVSLPFEVAGKKSFFVPSERFVEFLEKLRDTVNGGELDDAITSEGTSSAGGVVRKRRSPNMTDEQKAARSAKASATRARNKAAKTAND